MVLNSYILDKKETIMAGSSYGNIFRVTTWGESHGKGLGVVVDGVPAGLELCEEDIQIFLNRRKPGQSKFTTPRKEDDAVEILSGVFEGKTTGTPVSMVVWNKNQKSKDYSEIASYYRPGHADFCFAEDLSGKIAMIIDGGPVGIGIESTIIDLTEDTPMVLRPGYITPQMLSKVLGKEVVIDPGIIAADDTRKPKAPGMKYKHYAPKADMAIVDGTRKHVIAKINELVASHRDDGKKIAVIATEETKQFYDADVVLSMGSRADEDSIAHELYRILRDCDELDVDVIFSESFSTPRIGQAIMNRMLKAAGHQVIDTHVKYDKIIFVAQTGTCREQMAKGIMNDFVLKVPMEIEARGLVVQFPEPVNQKAEAVLISNGISTEGMVSTQLEESDITETTMVFTMESSQRERIIESFADIDPEQVFVLSQYVGDELEILDPYGGTLQSYGLCYESLRATLKKLVKLLNANT